MINISNGNVNKRILDAISCKTTVLTNNTTSSEIYFRNLLLTYASYDDMKELIDEILITNDSSSKDLQNNLYNYTKNNFNTADYGKKISFSINRFIYVN